MNGSMWSPALQGAGTFRRGATEVQQGKVPTMADAEKCLYQQWGRMEDLVASGRGGDAVHERLLDHCPVHNRPA